MLSLLGGYYDKEQGLTEFTITGLTSSGSNVDKYYSMAFSVDTAMGDDLVTDCYVTSDGKVKVGSSINSGGNKDNKLSDEWKDSLHSIEAGFVDGVVRCKWRSPRKRMASGREWDLLDSKYHVLLAMGNLEDDNGHKSYHEHRLGSNEKINLELMGAISTTDPIYLVRIHGMCHSIAPDFYI